MADCPFCGQSRLECAFSRGGRIFHRCLSCDARVQLNPVVHETWDSYERGEFVERVIAERGSLPEYQKLEWAKPYLVGSSVLEIGPGTGQFLAAAQENGYSVSGIEFSQVHREYVLRRWGIALQAAAIEQNQIPAGSFDNVVSFNCLEHVPDPGTHLKAIERVLRPGGRVLISTCNADSLVPRLVGKWWSMYAVPDHFAVPSKRSMAAVAASAGLSVVRVWTAEYPLETPVGLAVALRDWRNETRNSDGLGNATTAVGIIHTHPTRVARIGRALLQRRVFSPIGGTIGFLGLGGALKACFEKPNAEHMPAPAT